MADGALDLLKDEPGLGVRTNVEPGAGEAGKVLARGVEEAKLAPGRGDAGKAGKRLTPGFGEDGSPTRGVKERSVTADSGSTSERASETLRE